MSDPKNYTVGWICAVTCEYVAARAFLDDEHAGPEYLPPHNKNEYTLGRIGKHNVVLSVLPLGSYGISSAGRVAEDMLHSFPNVRVNLMVGIGGGAPSPNHDVRLGDVVVSIPCNGRGGLLQYDFGKTIQDRRFELTGFLNEPPIVLRAAVNGLRARYVSEGHQIEQAINEVLNKKPRLRKRFMRPNQETDRLYKSHIVHPKGGSTCAIDCGGDLTSLVLRKPRSEDEDNPEIHYGLIASANQLMKNAVIRDTLAANTGVLCFEMEAAGLMNHFPCLVIRGICDYSDSHKSDEWQGYAAMTAAAYAKDLLCRIVPQRVESEARVHPRMNPATEPADSPDLKLEQVQREWNTESKAPKSDPDPTHSMEKEESISKTPLRDNRATKAKFSCFVDPNPPQVYKRWSKEPLALEGDSHAIHSVAFSPDSRTLASGSLDVRLWDTATGTLRHTLKGHSNVVWSVAFSPNGRILASGSSDKTIRLWDAVTGDLQQILMGHADEVYSVAFSPVSQRLASGSRDKTIKLWDVATGRLKHILVEHLAAVRTVAFSPDGRRLASGSSDNTIRLWDAATGRLQQTIEYHSHSVYSVAFSSDGRMLASGSGDKTVRLWDTTTGAQRHVFKRHSGRVTSVAFSLDCQVVVSGSVDSTVQVCPTVFWPPSTQKYYKEHSSSIWSLAFSPDGSMMASGFEDKTALLWDASRVGHALSLNTTPRQYPSEAWPFIDAHLPDI